MDSLKKVTDFMTTNNIRMLKKSGSGPSVGAKKKDFFFTK